MTGVTAKVEIEFTAGVWTDVTGYWDGARPISISVGRSDVDERVQPGRLSGLVLDNTDGRFTVGNTSGAYSPNVTLGKRVRVSVRDSALDYRARFTGHIDGWPLSWTNNGTKCWVTISATDALGQLTRPVDWYTYAHTSYGTRRTGDETLRGYWPMTGAAGDKAATVQPDVSGLGAEPLTCVIITSPRPTEASPVPITDAPVIQGVAGASDYFTTTMPTTSARWAVGAWIKSSVTTPDTIPIQVSAGASPVGLTFESTDGYPRAQIDWYTSGTVATWTGGSEGGPYTGVDFDVTDGVWRYWVLCVQPDYAATATPAAIFFTCFDGNHYQQWRADTSAAAALAITGTKYLRVGGSGASIGHVSVWDTTSGKAFPEYIAGEGFALDTLADYPLQVVGTILGAVGVTDYDNIGSNVARMAPLPVRAGDTPLTVLGRLEASDAGITYADLGGTVMHIDGATTRYDGGGIAAPVSYVVANVDDIQLACDTTKTVNKVTVRNAGWPHMARAGNVTETEIETNTASVTAVGERSVEVDAYLFSQAWTGGTDSTVTTEWWERLASTRMNPAESVRIPQLTLDPLTLPATQQDQVLAFRPWHRIRITDLPSVGGFATAWTGWIEGWSETLGIAEWRIAYNLSTAGAVVGTDKVGSAKVG